MIENGKTYRVKGESKYFADKYGTANPEIRVEGPDTQVWPDGGWGAQQGNPACLLYAMRAGTEGIGIGGKVYYGKIGHSGELVHESELELVAAGA